MKDIRRSSLAGWIVAGIVLAVFLPSVFNDFVDWDDLPMIVQNPRFNPPAWSGVGWYWTHAAWNLYMPLTCTLWAALAKIGWVATADQFGGHMNPLMFHIASVLLHVLAAMMMFEILRIAVSDRWAAACGAILFAVHPIVVEAVAFAGAMNNVLCGAFSLAAIWQYLRWSGAVAENRRGSLLVGTVALVFAMLSKPTAVVVPPIAILLDRIINQRNWKEIFRSIVPWALLCVPCIMWTKFLQHGPVGERTSILARPLIAGDAAGFYLAKILLPIQMGVDYGRTPKFVVSHGEMIWVLGIVVVAVWAIRKSLPITAVGLVILLAALLPNSGLAPFDFQKISTVADRYAYLAMIGPALAVAEMAAKRRWMRAIVIGAIAVLIVRTEMQIRFWRNGEMLFHHAIAVNPNSWMSWSNLADILADREPAEAIFDCQQALRINPGDANSWNTLGSILMSQGDPPGAVAAFARACSLAPDNPMYADNYRRAAASSRN